MTNKYRLYSPSIDEFVIHCHGDNKENYYYLDNSKIIKYRSARNGDLLDLDATRNYDTDIDLITNLIPSEVKLIDKYFDKYDFYFTNTLIISDPGSLYMIYLVPGSRYGISSAIITDSIYSISGKSSVGCYSEILNYLVDSGYMISFDDPTIAHRFMDN